LAVEADILSMDDFRDRKYRTSQKRWEIVAALHELIDKGYIKRTEDEPEDHRHLDEWNFRLTPRGKDYAYRLLTKGREERSASTREAGLVKPTRIFISSTWEDLQPEREAVEQALHRMQDTSFAGMEYFGSRPETPKEVSLAEVDRSDVYIGIFAHRYGSGITEAEYRRARKRDIPCLIYLKDDSVPVPPAYIERDPEKIAKLEALKRDLKEQHTVSFFKSPDHLATQVVADLHNLLGSASSAREEKPAQPGPKYQITITDSQGITIGEQLQVTQYFQERSSETESSGKELNPG
jgi:DNA-binding PadR family transcriptional regulator